VSQFEDLDTFLSEGNRLTNTHAFFPVHRVVNIEYV